MHLHACVAKRQMFVRHIVCVRSVRVFRFEKTRPRLCCWLRARARRFVARRLGGKGGGKVQPTQGTQVTTTPSYK